MSFLKSERAASLGAMLLNLGLGIVVLGISRATFASGGDSLGTIIVAWAGPVATLVFFMYSLYWFLDALAPGLFGGGRMVDTPQRPPETVAPAIHATRLIA